MRPIIPLLVIGLSLGGCSPLKTFNAVIPKDSNSAQIATNIAYAPHDRQQLDIYAPDSEVGIGTSQPVVVFFYGGSWNSGTKDGYDFVGRALASRGFLTVIPDYRLVPEIRYPAFVEDGADAVRWAKANAQKYGGDPECIVLAGHSAGAYIAAMLAVDERWLAADRANIRGVVGLAGPYDFIPFEGQVTQDAFDTWPEPRETQPVTWAGEGDPAALLLTGRDDKTVLPYNSERLAALLQEGGVSARVKTYPDLGHVGIVTAIAKPLRGNAPVLSDMASFVEEVCANRSAEAVD